MKRVSIIVLGYNVEEYILRCLNSIINQSYKNIEIIYIDDCSTDGTWRRVLEFVRKNNENDNVKILIHRNNNNIGSASSRNVGLANANGEFFTFVDGDDWIEHDGIENMIAQTFQEEADLIASGFIYDKEGELTIDKQDVEGLYNIDIIKYMLLGKVHGSVCNKLYRKSVINENNIQFLDGADYTEDLAFNIKFLLHTQKIKYNNTPYYHYCIRGNSMSRNESTLKTYVRKRDLEKIQNIKNIEKELVSLGVLSKVKRELNYLKIGARMPLLDYPTNEKCELWLQTFPESNYDILMYDKLGIKFKFKLLLLILHLNSFFLILSHCHKEN